MLVGRVNFRFHDRCCSNHIANLSALHTLLLFSARCATATDSVMATGAESVLPDANYFTVVLCNSRHICLFGSLDSHSVYKEEFQTEVSRTNALLR